MEESKKKKGIHRSINKFEQLAKLYEDTVRSVTDPQDYFSSGEYASLKRLAHTVFDKVKSKSGVLMAIAQGSKKGEDIGCPGIESALCFPSRFLKEPSTQALPDELRIATDELIENTFFLGLMCHLLLNKFPSRDNVKQVDMDTLARLWGQRALVADITMKAYSRDLNNLPVRIFESYFTSDIEPTLKKKLKLGFWKVGKCRSYFRNLFFSGAFFGMQVDLLTK